jgi:hypothetical protein
MARSPARVIEESAFQLLEKLNEKLGRNSMVLAESGRHCRRKSPRRLWPLSRALDMAL